MKKKIIHIHTDYKFIHNSSFFESDLYDNFIIILQNEQPYAGDYKNNAILLTTSFNDLRKVLDLCEEANLVVLYDLDAFKIKIAINLPESIKIAWRFFGYELYRKRSDLYKSSLSRSLESNSKFFKIRQELSLVYNFLKKGSFSNHDFVKAVKRIDFFLALSKEEYTHLKKTWTYLPKLIKLPHFPFDRNNPKIDFTEKETVKPIVILGNNRSSYNNHLDLISLIDRYKTKGNYDFTLFFNYGNETKYSKEVVGITKNKKYYTLVTEFLDYNDFLCNYQKAQALVINGYRQMAGANIRLALESGVKVYLNEKNAHKQFLENQGFVIFTITDFENDLKNNKLGFDKTVALHNIENFKRFSEAYTKEDFQKQVFDLVNKIN